MTMTTTTMMLVTVAVLGVFFSYTVLAPIAMNVARFVGRTWMFCPHHHRYGRVKLNALWAALSGGYGAPLLSVRQCTLLGKGETCDQKCLDEVDL